MKYADEENKPKITIQPTTLTVRVHIDDSFHPLGADLVEVSMANASLKKSGLAADEAEEADVIVAVERGMDLDGRLDDLGFAHFRSQILNDSQCVAVIEIEEHHVGPELGFVGAEDILQGQIVVELLETLQAFGQVFRVDFLVEDVKIFFAKPLGAISVPTSAFLHLR